MMTMHDPTGFWGLISDMNAEDRAHAEAQARQIGIDTDKQMLQLSNRRKLPDQRLAIVDHFDVGQFSLYVVVGFFEDGSPGELFVKIAKEGSTISGLIEMFCIVTSTGLQHGVPWPVLAEKLSNHRFEPSDETYSSLADAITQSVNRCIERMAKTRKVAA